MNLFIQAIILLFGSASLLTYSHWCQVNSKTRGANSLVAMPYRFPHFKISLLVLFLLFCLANFLLLFSLRSILLYLHTRILEGKIPSVEIVPLLILFGGIGFWVVQSKTQEGISFSLRIKKLFLFAFLFALMLFFYSYHFPFLKTIFIP